MYFSKQSVSMLVFIFFVFIYPFTDSSNSTWPTPPKWTEKAKMARYLVHYANWGVVSALSPEYHLVPFGTLQSYTDGKIKASSGYPYFYISKWSDTYKNVNYNNSISFALSLAESFPNHCRKMDIDPESPVCARVTLVGHMVTCPKHERGFAKSSLFSRHPEMKYWPSDHGWDFYKMTLTHVHLLDYFGGATRLPLDQYFKASP